MGTRDAISSLLDKMQTHGPNLGLHLNLSKCEVYWPFGDQEFFELPSEIIRVLQMEEGAHLLGSPVYGSAEFIENYAAKKVEKILEMQLTLGI